MWVYNCIAGAKCHKLYDSYSSSFFSHTSTEEMSFLLSQLHMRDTTIELKLPLSYNSLEMLVEYLKPLVWYLWYFKQKPRPITDQHNWSDDSHVRCLFFTYVKFLKSVWNKKPCKSFLQCIYSNVLNFNFNICVCKYSPTNAQGRCTLSNEVLHEEALVLRLSSV